MKKQLLSATALVAAGALAAGAANAATVKVGVAGYMEQIVGVVFDRQDASGASTTTAVSSLAQNTEAEVHFKGSGKLDNGIEIVHDVQLEVAGSPSTSGSWLDEQYMIVRGNFGQVILGAEDGAGYLMTLGYAGSWATQVGANLMLDRGDWISAPAGFNRGNSMFLSGGIDNDSNKVTYISPRFSGFQAGVSYIPNANQQTAPCGVAVSGGCNLPTKAVSNEGWSLGLNYVGKFDNVNVGIAGGYLTSKPGGPGTGQDRKDWIVASSVQFGAFKVAAGVNRRVNDGGSPGAASSTEGTVYDVGARYTMGANSFSIAYSKGSIEGATATSADDEETGFAVEYARALGAGVKLTGSLLYSEYDDELNTPTSTRDGWAALTSIRITF
jgi:predicted porin